MQKALNLIVLLVRAINYALNTNESLFCNLSYTGFITLTVHHRCLVPKGRSFTADSGTKAAVLSKGRSSTANSETEFAVLLGMNRYGSFQLLLSRMTVIEQKADFHNYRPLGAGALGAGIFLYHICNTLSILYFF